MHSALTSCQTTSLLSFQILSHTSPYNMHLRYTNPRTRQPANSILYLAMSA